MCIFEQGANPCSVRVANFAKDDEEYECTAAIKRAAECMIAVVTAYMKDEVKKDLEHGRSIRTPAPTSSPLPLPPNNPTREHN